MGTLVVHGTPIVRKGECIDGHRAGRYDSNYFEVWASKNGYPSLAHCRLGGVYTCLLGALKLWFCLAGVVLMYLAGHTLVWAGDLQSCPQCVMFVTGTLLI